MAGMSGGHSRRKGHTPSGSGELAQGQGREDTKLLRDSLVFKELGGSR